jgi:hypothetical protein
MVAERIWIIVKSYDDFHFVTSDNPVLLGTSQNALDASLHLMKRGPQNIDFTDLLTGFECSLALSPQYMLLLLDPNQSDTELQYSDKIRDLRDGELAKIVGQILMQTNERFYFSRHGDEIKEFQGFLPHRKQQQALSALKIAAMWQTVNKN